MEPPRTSDGRYLVVEGKAGPRLWRASNPALDEGERQALVDALMAARRAVRAARDCPDGMAAARASVNSAKLLLGERGAPWWSDGSPDFNRVLVKNSPYRSWWQARGGR